MAPVGRVRFKINTVTGSRRNVCSFDSEPDSEPAFDSDSDQISESDFDTGVRRRARPYGQAGGSVDHSWS